MKKPDDCRNLNDVREGIDSIDKEIFQLLLKRLEYVYSASQFKPDEVSISAPDRVESMLALRQQWAQENNIDETMIKIIYENIIQQFISAQIKYWRKNKGLS